MKKNIFSFNAVFIAVIYLLSRKKLNQNQPPRQ